MRRLIMLVIIGALAWQGYVKYQATQADQSRADDEAVSEGMPANLLSGEESGAADRFRCDGRAHCSQMTSCAEATYFLRNCPGLKMDGDHDGVPCELQWCN